MTDSQELITKLKNQHSNLQKDLSLIVADLKSGMGEKDDTVVLKLTKFKNDLIEHLKIENKEFYPDYLDKKIKRGEEITSAKEFIKQMDTIEKVVIEFLDKYATPESISANTSNFSSELSVIINALNARVETEEEGLFGLYLLL